MCFAKVDCKLQKKIATKTNLALEEKDVIPPRQTALKWEKMRFQ